MFSIVMAIILSDFIIALVMVVNRAAGSKYGVPIRATGSNIGIKSAFTLAVRWGGITKTILRGEVNDDCEQGFPHVLKVKFILKRR